MGAGVGVGPGVGGVGTGVGEGLGAGIGVGDGGLGGAGEGGSGVLTNARWVTRIAPDGNSTVPVRSSPAFLVTCKVRSALPVPSEIDTLIHGAREEAVHKQKSSVVSRTRASPPDAARDTRSGDTVHSHLAASWEMTTRCSAATSSNARGLVEGFGSIWYEISEGPFPCVAELKISHAALVVTLHVHSRAVFTRSFPAPPVASIVAGLTSRAMLHRPDGVVGMRAVVPDPHAAAKTAHSSVAANRIGLFTSPDAARTCCTRQVAKSTVNLSLLETETRETRPLSVGNTYTETACACVLTETMPLTGVIARSGYRRHSQNDMRLIKPISCLGLAATALPLAWLGQNCR